MSWFGSAHLKSVEVIFRTRKINASSGPKLSSQAHGEEKVQFLRLVLRLLTSDTKVNLLTTKTGSAEQ